MRGNGLRRGVKLQHLRILVTVAECGSMGKAAKQLYLSQPVVSKAISDLEKMLKVSLFDRQQHGVEPTLFGKALLNRSKALFEDLETSFDEIAFLADPSKGTLSFGGTDHLLAGLGAAVMQRLWLHHPGISFKVVHADFETLIGRDLPGRRIELAIAPLLHFNVQEGISIHSLFEDNLKLIVGKSSPLANLKHVTLVDLQNERWCVTPSPIGALIAESFRVSRLSMPRLAIATASAQMALQMVEKSGFVGHFGDKQLAFFTDRYAIKRLPIDLPAPPFTVAILTLKDKMLSPLAQEFLQCAFEIGKSFEPSTTVRRSNGRKKKQ